MHTRIPKRVYVTDLERFALNFGLHNQNVKRIPMHTMHTGEGGILHTMGDWGTEVKEECGKISLANIYRRVGVRKT